MSYKVEFGLRGHDISRVSLEDMAQKAEELGITRVQFAMRVTMSDVKWQNGMFSFGYSFQKLYQLCAIGYIILFFSGLNLVSENKCSISPANMIVSIFIVLLFRLWR